MKSFDDYNQYYEFLDKNQELLKKYAWCREYFNSVSSICSCASKRQARIAIAKSKYVMNAKMLEQDEWAREDFKKILNNEVIVMFNDGEKLIEF